MSSSKPRDLPPVLPDDAPFDAASYAWGAWAYDDGMSLWVIAQLDCFAAENGRSPDQRLAYRKSVCFGYLAALKVAAERGRKPVWSG